MSLSFVGFFSEILSIANKSYCLSYASARGSASSARTARRARDWAAQGRGVLGRRGNVIFPLCVGFCFYNFVNS